MRCMKIKTLSLKPYEFALKSGSTRSGVIINLEDEKGNTGCGDVAPLLGRSTETLEQAVVQIEKISDEIQKDLFSEHAFDECLYLRFCALLPLY